MQQHKDLFRTAAGPEPAEELEGDKADQLVQRRREKHLVQVDSTKRMYID